MNKLLGAVIERANALPDDEQEQLAKAMLRELDGDTEWERLFAGPRSEQWLEKQAAAVRKAVNEGRVTEFDPDNLPE